MPLTRNDFERAAERLDVDVPSIRAVDEVESAGRGFLKNGEPKILFEAHWFSRFTDGKYDNDYPNISSPKWDQSLYKGGTKEHDRLSKAADLNRTAALKSASWGRYQIMGFNWKDCKYESLQEFINGAYEGEGEHLNAFVRFIETQNLAKPLRNKDWATFARRYNGPGYKQNNYDTRLQKAYQKYLEQEEKDKPEEDVPEAEPAPPETPEVEPPEVDPGPQPQNGDGSSKGGCLSALLGGS